MTRTQPNIFLNEPNLSKPPVPSSFIGTVIYQILNQIQILIQLVLWLILSLFIHFHTAVTIQVVLTHESIRVTLDNAQLIADQLSFVNSFILCEQSMYNVRWYEQPRTQTEFRVQVNVIFAIHKTTSTSSWNYSKSGVFFDT